MVSHRWCANAWVRRDQKTYLSCLVDGERALAEQQVHVGSIIHRLRVLGRVDALRKLGILLCYPLHDLKQLLHKHNHDKPNDEMSVRAHTRSCTGLERAVGNCKHTSTVYWTNSPW